MKNRREFIGAVAGAIATGSITSLAVADSSTNKNFAKWLIERKKELEASRNSCCENYLCRYFVPVDDTNANAVYRGCEIGSEVSFERIEREGIDPRKHLSIKPYHAISKDASDRKSVV